MHRRTTTTSLALVTLVVGLLAALAPPPATATGTSTGAPAARQDYPKLGHADIRNQRLRPGCHHYRVRYVVRAPSDEWSAIVQVRTPRNRKAGSLLLDVNTPDPRTGSRTLQLCGTTLVPGRYTIQMQVIYDVGRDQYRAWTKPRYFRLTRR